MSKNTQEPKPLKEYPGLSWLYDPENAGKLSYEDTSKRMGDMTPEELDIFSKIVAVDDAHARIRQNKANVEALCKLMVLLPGLLDSLTPKTPKPWSDEDEPEPAPAPAPPTPAAPAYPDGPNITPEEKALCELLDDIVLGVVDPTPDQIVDLLKVNLLGYSVERGIYNKRNGETIISLNDIKPETDAKIHAYLTAPNPTPDKVDTTKPKKTPKRGGHGKG